MSISFFDYPRLYHNFTSELIENIKKTIERGDFINGQEVGLFEDNLKSYTGSRHCLAVSSGTDALTAALMTIKNKKKFALSPSFTFVASAMTAYREGYQIKFIDVQKNQFKPSIELVIDNICKDTSVVIWPHLFGESTDLQQLKEYCDQREIVLIEDCAQSLGSYIKKQHVGNQGHFGCFSFFPAKNLGAFGDGGAVIAQNKDDFELLEQIKSHGFKKDKKYFSVRTGGNFRLDTIQASILNTLLPKLNSWLEARSANALLYDKEIKNSLLHKPKMSSGHSWNQYTILADDNKRFKDYMKSRGIDTMIYYPYPLHRNLVFNSKQILKNTDDICKRVISIPVYPGLQQNELSSIIEAANEYR